ncbi:YitT family protein [Salibacterium salarium]|uniref:YitT family protein n=1 Tax=Salibacterium salarium TaxID=284579 RepID=A0A3R9QHY2_9BACI|nr:YitT family protein [Salibacterium salarium]RSL30789.1 YitT family protein [Salibacterium salarium]
MSWSKRREPMPKNVQRIIHALYILAGSTILAVSYNLFLLPNRIASGGLSGFATIFYEMTGTEPAITLWSLNIPVFIAGILLLGGWKYGGKTLAGTLFVPLVIYLTRNVEPAVNDPLLAALFGGIGVGAGLGLVFRAYASTGGTDLIAQIIHKYTGASLGACVFIMDGLIVTTSAFVFSLEFALYALIALFVTGKTIDVVQTGVGYAKVALIITRQEQAVQEAILNQVDRGVTRLSGEGGYTQDPRPVLMCVVQQNEVTKLKQLVQTTDTQAFVVVTNATEVLGKGFKI